jgi:hypothetical protein
MQSAEAFETRTYHKVDIPLIPFLFLCYMLAYPDRVNVGFAKLRMLKDPHRCSPAIFHDSGQAPFSLFTTQTSLFDSRLFPSAKPLSTLNPAI